MSPSVAKRIRKFDQTSIPSDGHLRRSSRLAKKARLVSNLNSQLQFKPHLPSSILDEHHLLLLFDNLPIMEKLKASCVCTPWRQLIIRLPIIQRLDVTFCTPVKMIRSHLNPNSLQGYPKHLKAMSSAQQMQLSYLDIGHKTEQGFTLFRRQFQFLRVLIVHSCFRKECLPDRRELELSYFPWLEHLELQNLGLYYLYKDHDHTGPEDFIFYPTLAHPSLKYLYTGVLIDLQVLAHALPALSHVEFDNCKWPGIMALDWDPLLDGKPLLNLTHYSFDSYDYIKEHDLDPVLDQLIYSCPNLTSVQIAPQNYMQIHRLYSEVSGLRELHLLCDEIDFTKLDPYLDQPTKPVTWHVNHIPVQSVMPLVSVFYDRYVCKEILESQGIFLLQGRYDGLLGSLRLLDIRFEQLYSLFMLRPSLVFSSLEIAEIYFSNDSQFNPYLELAILTWFLTKATSPNLMSLDFFGVCGRWQKLLNQLPELRPTLPQLRLCGNWQPDQMDRNVNPYKLSDESYLCLRFLYRFAELCELELEVLEVKQAKQQIPRLWKKLPAIQHMQAWSINLFAMDNLADYKRPDGGKQKHRRTFNFYNEHEDYFLNQLSMDPSVLV